jgi:hypothetical protein
MAGALTLLVVAAAVGVGVPTLGIWLRVQRRRCAHSTSTARSDRNPGRAAAALAKTASAGAADLAQEAPTTVRLKQHDGAVVLDEVSLLRRLASDAANEAAEGVTPMPVEVATGADGDWDGERDLTQGTATTLPLKQHAEQAGEVVLDETPGLKHFASDTAYRAAEDVAPAPPVEIATGAYGEWSQERDQAAMAPEQTTGSELVLSGFDTVEDDARSPPRDGTKAPLRPASAPDAEAYGGFGPALPDTPSALEVGQAEVAPRESEHRAAVASSSKVTQSHEFADQGEVRAAEVCGGERNEDEDLAAATETAGEAEQSAAESAPCVAEGEAANPVYIQNPATKPAMSGIDVLTDSVSEDAVGDAGHADEPVWTRPRPSKPAQHRDRRGQRRALSPQPAPSVERPSPAGAALRTPAEAKLRLMLHPIRRAAALSAVLARPAGYPDRITLLLGEDTEKIGAYSEDLNLSTIGLTAQQFSF